MNLKMPQDQLIQKLKDFGYRHRETSQIVRRLKELLPERVRELKRRLRSRGKAASAERAALCSEDYLSAVNEYLSLLEQSQSARIQYETHRMLQQARQSTRLYQLAAAQAAARRSKVP